MYRQTNPGPNLQNIRDEGIPSCPEDRGAEPRTYCPESRDNSASKHHGFAKGESSHKTNRLVRAWLRLGSLAVFLLLLTGCPGSAVRTQPDGPRFRLESPGTCAISLQHPQSQGLGSLCGTDVQGCRAFRDSISALRFCVPKDTDMQILQYNPDEDPVAFEVRLLIKSLGIVLYLRKDVLPAELAEGALAGKWSLRYAESYMRRRGAELRETQRKILSTPRSRYVHAHSLVWAAFPFAYAGQEYWEELLVLSREPNTRYLVSIRVAERVRRDMPQALQQFLLLFLHQLRLGPPVP